MATIIPNDRAKVAETIAAYLRGEIDNFALDDATMGYTGNDKSITAIALGLWPAYDDVKRHKVSLNRPCWKAFRRCIAFLQTDLTCSRNHRIDLLTWPFSTRHSILAVRPNLKRYNLPRFDPNVHSIPIRTKPVNVLLGVVWIVAFAAAMVWIGSMIWHLFR